MGGPRNRQSITRKCDLLLQLLGMTRPLEERNWRVQELYGRKEALEAHGRKEDHASFAACRRFFKKALWPKRCPTSITRGTQKEAPRKRPRMGLRSSCGNAFITSLRKERERSDVVKAFHGCWHRQYISLGIYARTLPSLVDALRSSLV